MASNPTDPHSIDNEPHLLPMQESAPSPIEPPLSSQAPDSPMHSVWDEPGRSDELSGSTPEDALTYSRWLADQREQTSPSWCWWVTGIIVLLAGPFSILGTLLSPMFMGIAGFMGVISLVLFGPLVEELMKTALAFWVVENRPHWFRSTFQILLTAVGGGLVFSAIENLMYLNIYIENPTAEIILWRWTVCVFLHTGCSFITGLGLARTWKNTWSRLETPRMGIGLPYLTVAVVIHGSYNGLCILLERTIF